MAKNSDFEWLVRARFKNQRSLLRLYEIGDAKHPKLIDPGQNWERDAFNDLVGAGFSLWRAAFLCDAQRTPKKIFDGGQALLKALLEDNAVPYGKERGTSNWMGGIS